MTRGKEVYRELTALAGGRKAMASANSLTLGTTLAATLYGQWWPEDEPAIAELVRLAMTFYRVECLRHVVAASRRATSSGASTVGKADIPCAGYVVPPIVDDRAEFGHVAGIYVAALQM
jgi:hypothetical protein